jgi:GAF domain-containing protein
VTERDLHAAIAAGIGPAEEQFGMLLQSIVDVGRAIFGARAASIFLLDEAADELVFAAVSGEGEESLIGRRFPSGTGVAGWVLVTRQPLVIEDVGEDERFSREAAEATGYLPHGLMAVPLLHEEEVLGVLEILDRPQRARFSLGEMDLLSLFAGQAAVALALLRRAREAKAALEGRGELETVAALAAALAALEGSKREATVRLLETLRELLEPPTR